MNDIRHEPEPCYAQQEWAGALFNFIHGLQTAREAGLVLLPGPDGHTDVVHVSGYHASLPSPVVPRLLTSPREENCDNGCSRSTREGIAGGEWQLALFSASPMTESCVCQTERE